VGVEKFKNYMALYLNGFEYICRMAKVARKAVGGTAVRRAAVEKPRLGRITPKKITNGPLEWYDLTEQTKAILNNRLAISLKLRAVELRWTPQNQNTVQSLTNSIDEILRISDNPRTFQSLASMKKIVAKYAANPAGNNR
jgi:hypothetical protein